MKSHSIIPLCLGGFLLAALPSCVVPGPPLAHVGVGVGYGYYDTLPAGYGDPYYYYNNRYYYGGRWETGRYVYNGHVHTGRYVHNGHYYYGGRYDLGHHHGGTVIHRRRH